MSRHLHRRRFLAISAAGFACAGTSAAASQNIVRWRGTALGASCSMQLVDVDELRGASILRAVEAELSRLEAIFSLYRPNSELRRLNLTGELATPSAELLKVLSTCHFLHHTTEGAFDPTVQPLFDLYAGALTEGRQPTATELENARALVGWESVGFDENEVRLTRPGSALTLNGVAQGFITDRIAALLQSYGLRNVLIDMGEVVASGQGSSKGPWRAGISDLNGKIVRRIELSDRALATSAPHAAALGPNGQMAHIFDPRTAEPSSALSLISVTARRAEIADGLSTALCSIPSEDRARVVKSVPEARIEILL